MGEGMRPAPPVSAFRTFKVLPGRMLSWIAFLGHRLNRPVWPPTRCIRAGGIPGKQTINRGEPWALFQLIKDLSQDITAVADVTDSLLVLRNFNTVSEDRLPSTQCDIWVDVRQHLGTHKLCVIKVESHQTVAEAISANVHPILFRLNDTADFVAGKVGKRIHVDSGTEKGMSYAQIVAHRIRQRLAATL